MAFKPVPYGIEVALHATQDGQELVNTLGFRANTNPPTNAEVIAAAQAVQTTFAPEYALLCTSSCHFYKIVATNVSAQNAYQYEIPIDITGGITASQPLPLSVAAVVSMFALRGKGRKGRNFTFGMCESQTDGDTVSAGYIDDMTIVYNSLPTAPGTGGVVWAILYRSINQAVPVNSFTIRSTVGVQKDRLPGHKKRRRHVP